MNKTMNVNYVEYDPDWKWAEGAPLQHYELYDVAADPHQMHNLFDATPEAQKAALHAELAAYYACRADTCP